MDVNQRNLQWDLPGFLDDNDALHRATFGGLRPLAALKHRSFID
jgi:hypothetical protein